MEHNDNEQRLRILQERLEQIKNKQKSKKEQRVEDPPPYPTYNPKEIQSSNVDIASIAEEKEKGSFVFSWKFAFTILIIIGISYGGYFLYKNYDLKSSLPKRAIETEQIINNKTTEPLQYSLDFGEAKHLVIFASCEDENTAIELANSKTTEGYTSNYFFLPLVSNSNEQIYKVYLGPYFSQSEAKQWAGTLEIESEILNL